MHIEVVRLPVFPKPHTGVPITIVSRPKDCVCPDIPDSTVCAYGVIRESGNLGPNFLVIHE